MLKCNVCIWEGEEFDLLDGIMVEYTYYQPYEKIIGYYKACPLCKSKIDIKK
jgi:hypothetical protein